ncbi:MAG: FtsX-like permease family protein, partial [Deltaproteobacteria bacterium]|nr:FtsX-like permease family protein [Deltaproteobacteria bacterium]
FASFQAMLTGISTLCLIAGVFIVYNTTSTGALRRVLALATLRHIGADSRTLFRLLMLEAAMLGTLGTAAGIGLGVGLAHLLTDMVTQSMGVIFQLRFPIHSMAIDPFSLAIIASAGISAVACASYFAAHRVTSLSPLDAIRNDVSTLARQRPTAALLAVWAGLVALSALSLYLQVRWKSSTFGNIGSTIWFASSIIIAVPIVDRSAPLLMKVLRHAFAAEGRVAADSLVRSVTRTGVTVAAIALVLTLAILVATVAVSFRESVNSYFASGFLASDLAVSAVSTEGGWLETPISMDVAREIEKIDGVGSVDVLRVLPGQPFRGARVTIAAVSDRLFDPSRYPRGWYLEGDPESAATEIRAGRGARISTNLSERFDLHVHDMIELATPQGPLSLEVVDVVPDYMSDQGTIALSLAVLRQYWNDRLVSRISVFAGPGVAIEGLRERIASQLGDRYRLKILSLPEVSKYHSEMIDRAFAFTDAIQLLIIIVTIAGIFDLLLSTVLERQRELALWRVMGADKRAVRRCIVIEAATVGGLGAALGLLVGLGTSWIWVIVNFRYLLGYHLELHFAGAAAAWYVGLALLMTAAAGYAAASQATRLSVLEGISYE